MRQVMTFTVEIEWDGEAGVWYVAESNVPGLVAEASSQEAMTALLRERVPELLKLNMAQLVQARNAVPMELLYKQHECIELAS